MADRILTTHAGSLPRPDGLADLIWARTEGQDVDEAALEAQIDSAVAAVVARQRDAGIDVISDGEMRPGSAPMSTSASPDSKVARSSRPTTSLTSRTWRCVCSRPRG